MKSTYGLRSAPAGPRGQGEHGIALILVLLFLVIITGLVLAFFSAATTENSSAAAYSGGASAKMLSEVVVNLVEAQILDATRGQGRDASAKLAWASQPGMIRTYDSTGMPQKVFKLYSADDLSPAATDYIPDLAALPTDWTGSTYPDLYTDLNAPVMDSNKELIYPIVDPDAAQFVDGFAINNAPGGFDRTKPASASNNQAPMPVKWLYVLRDGTLVTPDTSTNGITTFKPLAAGTTSGPSKTNPIVSRIAYWADDETSKVNVNTASEGVYWDVPRTYTLEDYGKHTGSGTAIGTPGMAICQPAQHEYQRYPGHPATTSLSPILGKWLPSVTPPAAITATTAKDFDAYDKLAPRVTPGGSESGTMQPTQVLTIKQDRLYASVDELMFTPLLSGTARVPNTATGTSPNLITKQTLEKTKFFLTANSMAPEVTLYNTPRVSIWPVDVTPSKRNGFDSLSAFCSTIGGNSASLGNPYYFTRSPANARNSTGDLTARNSALYQYLQKLTSQPVPGFGGQSFQKKYPAPLAGSPTAAPTQGGAAPPSDCDQVLTYIFDYIRCANLQDITAATPYTPIFRNPGAGEVVPIKIGNTQGFGRFDSISEADILFYLYQQAPPANSPPNTPSTYYLCAHLILEFADPMQGLGCKNDNLAYTVSGLENLQVAVGGGGWQSLGFVSNGSNNGTNYTDHTDLDSFHGRSLGGTEGVVVAFLDSSGNAKPFTPGSNAPGKYPFATPTPATTPAPTSPIILPKTAPPTFMFRSAAPSSEIVVTVKTADTGIQIQAVHLHFPDVSTTLKMPTYSARQINGGTFGLVQGGDTVVGLEPSGILWQQADGQPNARYDGSAGDTRMIEGLAIVPSPRFKQHKDYMNQSAGGVQFAHGLLSAVGVWFQGATFGRLANVPNYQQNGSITRQPDVPSRVGDRAKDTGVKRADGGAGDWDTGVGDQKDGAYINKPDEGDSAYNDGQGGSIRLPYNFGFGQGFSASSRENFSPCRQLPSPMMFGSIPTGVQRFLPWQTLLFDPKPEDPSHPGLAGPKDHLLADLFWMPAVEPYAISQPFATAGKINMNYEIQPFTYLERSTGIHAVMKATKFLALDNGDYANYKPLDPGNTNQVTANRRLSIDMTQTLRGFQSVFAAKQIFKSATQICELNLVPPGQTVQSMAGFWRQHSLTGDNVREKPYVDLYPRLTTKSNTFTVHMRVQSLKKALGTPADQWVSGKDQVLGEYRGSSIIERYIDLNDPELAKVDFATDTTLNIDQYYKMRIVSTKRFSVD